MTCWWKLPWEYLIFQLIAQPRLFIYLIWQPVGAATTLFLICSPPTHTGAGHQWMVSTNTDCNQWLSVAEPGLKVARAGRNRSLVTCTSMYGCAISWRIPIIDQYFACHIGLFTGRNQFDHDRWRLKKGMPIFDYKCKLSISVPQD